MKGMLDYTPTGGVSASLFAKYAHDHYPDSTYGLRNNHNLSVGPDVNWAVSPSLNVHAFYTYHQLFYDLESIYESSTTVAPSASQFQVPWSNKATDSVHTAGVTLD
jgi:hypothetical protein